MCAARPWSGSRLISATDSNQLKLSQPLWVVWAAVWSTTGLSPWSSAVFLNHHSFEFGYWNAPWHQIPLLYKHLVVYFSPKFSPGFWQTEFMSSGYLRMDVVKYAQIKPWQNRVYHRWILSSTQEIRTAPTLACFRKRLKSYLSKKAFPSSMQFIQCLCSTGHGNSYGWMIVLIGFWCCTLESAWQRLSAIIVQNTIEWNIFTWVHRPKLPHTAFKWQCFILNQRSWLARVCFTLHFIFCANCRNVANYQVKQYMIWYDIWCGCHLMTQ